MTALDVATRNRNKGVMILLIDARKVCEPVSRVMHCNELDHSLPFLLLEAEGNVYN